MFRPLVVGAALLLSVAACKDDGGPKLSVAGSWQGSVMNPSTGNVFQFNSTLADASGTITGSGTIAGPGLNCAATIAGTRADASVSMSWTCPGITPVNYSGSLSDNEKISGTLNGSGFTNASLTLNKN
jgi:hypothetical protein